MQKSYSNIIKIPLAPPSSIVSETVTKKLISIKNNAGVSLVENRMPKTTAEQQGRRNEPKDSIDSLLNV